MNVGMIGLGKLGLPVATAMASRGLEVFGHDPFVSDYPDDLSYEENFADTVEAAQGRVHFSELPGVVANCDVIFCAVQTPHEPRFEGITPIPEDRADFDYSHLTEAVRAVVSEADKQQRHITLAVISTVLPGTMAREVEPLLGKYVQLTYNPSFIAMGTTIRDFTDPEFVLLGGDSVSVMKVACVYDALGLDRTPPVDWNSGLKPPSRCYFTSVPNAELIKVAYNTFIGLKLAFANTLMEVCHKTDCDVDEVTAALKLAHRRLISGAYLDGGMGDGGGCHPRDNIALSWLARELDLSYDLFEAAMMQREKQAEWLVEVMEQHNLYDLHYGILGVAYKPSSHLTAGSPALLVSQLLTDRYGTAPRLFDPHVYEGDNLPHRPRVWLVGCKHPEFVDLKLPEGSVVIDPWRYIPDQPGVEVIRIGEEAPKFASGGYIEGEKGAGLVTLHNDYVLTPEQVRKLG